MNKIQYTIRKIPTSVDKVLRKRAERENKPFNTVVVEALSLETLGSRKPDNDRKTALDRLWGANTLDAGFDEAIAEQSKIDPKLWK